MQMLLVTLYMPPFIILSAKPLNPNWINDELSGTRYADIKEWIGQELFHFLLLHNFLENVVARRPL